MSTNRPEYLSCSPDVVRGLIETVSAALISGFPKPSVDLSDVESIIAAVRVVRPQVPEVDIFDGILHMVRGNWNDAIHVLRNVGESAPRFGYAKALLAMCESVKGDDNWRQTAAEAMSSNPTRDTEYLVRALEARADLIEAMRVSHAGGRFVVPPSVGVLEQFGAEFGVGGQAKAGIAELAAQSDGNPDSPVAPDPTALRA